MQFRTLPDESLPNGATFGVTFTTLTINVHIHLKFPHDHPTSFYGVKLVRRLELKRRRCNALRTDSLIHSFLLVIHYWVFGIAASR